MKHNLSIFGCCVLLLGAGGCVAEPDYNLIHHTNAGEFGRARVYMASKVGKQGAAGSTSKKGDRTYVLDRMRLALVTLADGYPQAGEVAVEELYEMLRTQGINDDKTVSSVIFNEDLKIWKGEPFEQAMAFCYVGMHYATRGDWGNMRAAAENSLFQIRDFGHGDAEDVITESQESGADLADMYQPVASNFTLGYLLSALANQQLARYDQADGRYNDVVALAPNLQGLVDELKAGEYNTIVVVDYGQGPAKTATGPDNAISTFMPMTPSNPAVPLVVDDGQSVRHLPQVIDMNRIAQDLRWNNLEDMRVAKSTIGQLMMIGGTGALVYGADRRNNTAAFIGLGLLAAGAIARAGAHADTRYCEVVPQRVHVVPLVVNGAGQKIRFTTGDNPASAVTITGMQRPPPGVVLFRYVRLPSSLPAPAPWGAPGDVIYSNEHYPAADAQMFPFILGGNDVRPPSYAVLNDYQDAGYLLNFQLSDLEELYRAEGIEWEVAPGSQPRLHVLEGGKSLVAPLPGTAGYSRLFCQPHSPYYARTQRVRDIMTELAQPPAPVVAAGN